MAKLDDDATRKLLMHLGRTLFTDFKINMEICFEFLRFKEKAIKTVRTHVLLIPEAVNTKEMTKALKATSMPEWKGEVTSNANNECLGCL